MTCSASQLASKKKYRDSHKEEAAAYYVANMDKLLAGMAAYRESHRDELRAYDASRYQARHEEALACRRAYRDAHRDERRERDAGQLRWFYGNLRILKAAQGCDDCGIHEGRLDHHHIDSATKKYNVSSMCNYSLEKFMDEIAKCTVLCCSCHTKRHHAEMRALAA